MYACSYTPAAVLISSHLIDSISTSIAAPGPEAVADDSEWQAVGSRKTRPTQIKSHHKIFGFKPDSDGAMFETMVEGIMEKYQLTR